jgi:hypothetical protein
MSAPSPGPITKESEPAPSIHAFARSSRSRSSVRKGAKDAAAVMTGAPKKPRSATRPVSCHIERASMRSRATGTNTVSAPISTRRGSYRSTRTPDTSVPRIVLVAKVPMRIAS